MLSRIIQARPSKRHPPCRGQPATSLTKLQDLARLLVSLDASCERMPPRLPTVFLSPRVNAICSNLLSSSAHLAFHVKRPLNGPRITACVSRGTVRDFTAPTTAPRHSRTTKHAPGRCQGFAPSATTGLGPMSVRHTPQLRQDQIRRASNNPHNPKLEPSIRHKADP